MNKLSSIWPTLITLLVAIIFGLPVLFSGFYHPVSRMMSDVPFYKGLSKNSFMVMSASIDLASGRLIRYTDAAGFDQITRIVGMPGDQVRFEAGKLSVNGATVGEYPSISLPNSRLTVPQQHIFCFPDFRPESAKTIDYPALDNFVIPDAAINATILYAFNNDKLTEEQPELLAYGLVLIMLYGAIFFACGRRKAIIYPPIYYLARIAVGLNLVIWSIIGLYGVYTGLWAVFPAIYYVFVSWLTFLGLSIAEAGISLLVIVVIGVLTVFSDIAISPKSIKAEP